MTHDWYGDDLGAGVAVFPTDAASGRLVVNTRVRGTVDGRVADSRSTVCWPVTINPHLYCRGWCRRIGGLRQRYNFLGRDICARCAAGAGGC